MKNLFEKYNNKDIILFAITLDTILVNIIILILIYVLKKDTPLALLYLLYPIVIYNISIIVSYIYKFIYFNFENNKQEIWLNIVIIVVSLLNIVFSGLLYIIISLIDFPF